MAIIGRSGNRSTRFPLIVSTGVLALNPSVFAAEAPSATTSLFPPFRARRAMAHRHAAAGAERCSR